eukprot:311320-Chlamydomonas_euryale.AAC.1
MSMQPCTPSACMSAITHVKSLGVAGVLPFNRQRTAPQSLPLVQYNLELISAPSLLAALLPDAPPGAAGNASDELLAAAAAELSGKEGRVSPATMAALLRA